MSIDLISLISIGLAIASFFIGRVTASREKGKNDGVMLTEIGYIKRGIDDLTNKVEANGEHWRELENRVSVLERTVKMYHAN